MPIIRVSMYKGRTREQKADLAKQLTEVIVRVAKAPAEATHVIFEEVDKEDWAQGGSLAADK